MKRILLFLFHAVCLAIIANAQIIDTARFRLDYKPQLLNFPKINQPAIINDTVTSEIKFQYYITPQRLDVSFEPTPLKPVKLPPDAMKRLYRDFLKVGFGYPVTPLFQLSIHNPDNRKFSYGLNVHHFSSWAPQIGEKMKKYAYYPTSDTRAQVFFNTFFRNQTLYSSIGYNHRLAKLYGFNRDTLAYIPDIDRYYEKGYKDTLNNSFHHLKAEVGLRSNHVLEDKRLKQDVRLHYDFVRTFPKDMENHFGIKSYFAYDARFLRVSGSQNYRLGFDFDYYHNSWNDTIPGGEKMKDYSVKFELKPTVNFTIKEYHILFGLGLPIAYNYNLGETKVPIYPVAELQLGLIPGILSLYFGVDGKTEFNSLQNLLYENPFLKPQLDTLMFTRNQISIYGGIKGNLVKKLNYHVSARYGFEKDKHFFMLDTASLLKNRFGVVYGDVQTLNVCLNLNWEVRDHLYLNLDANYWGYYMLEKVEKPWYKPSWEIAFGGKYVYDNRMIFDLNFDMQFGRWGLVPTSVEGQYLTEKMKPVLDFGVGFEYLFSKRFSAFANIHNIAGQSYAKYYDFKSFGINVLFGITYSFGDESLRRGKR